MSIVPPKRINTVNKSLQKDIFAVLMMTNFNEQIHRKFYIISKYFGNPESYLEASSDQRLGTSQDYLH